MSCFYVASDQPRALRGRHAPECPALAIAGTGVASVDAGETNGPQIATQCAGCLPCPEPHCGRCYREHVQGSDLTCPGCIADTRADLAAITTLCRNLPAEARAKGVDSEAMNLLGPVADPEALGHVQASIHAGRLDVGWLSVADGEHHPLTFAWWWNECWREAFDHTETPAVSAGFGVVQLVTYLDANLAYAAQQDELPFADFAREASACRNHLERVLHDGEQVETGAPCMELREDGEQCGTRLLRVYEGGEMPWSHKDGSRARAIEDGWTCRRCHDWRSEKDYGLNLADEHLNRAQWLTAEEAGIKFNISPGTVRSLARTGGCVRSRRYAGRSEFSVEDLAARPTRDADACAT